MIPLVQASLWSVCCAADVKAAAVNINPMHVCHAILTAYSPPYNGLLQWSDHGEGLSSIYHVLTR